MFYVHVLLKNITAECTDDNVSDVNENKATFFWALSIFAILNTIINTVGKSLSWPQDHKGKVPSLLSMSALLYRGKTLREMFSMAWFELGS